MNGSGRSLTPNHMSKPLPMLPEISTSLEPLPLCINKPLSVTDMPRSHFSMSTISTISTTFTSPSNSHFEFSNSPSIADDDEDLSADVGSGDESTPSPADKVHSQFPGYSLPEGDYTSEQSLQKGVPLSSLNQAASRTTFGANPLVSSTEDDARAMTELEALLGEIGYLGDAIIGK